MQAIAGTMNPGHLKDICVVAEKAPATVSFMIGTHEFAIPMGNLIDVDAEVKKLEAQLEHLEGFLNGIEKKLGNEKFVAHAPEAVVAMERKKKADCEEKIATIRQSINALRH